MALAETLAARRVAAVSALAASETLRLEPGLGGEVGAGDWPVRSVPAIPQPQRGAAPLQNHG
jgi:hypothetical protein